MSSNDIRVFIDSEASITRAVLQVRRSCKEFGFNDAMGTQLATAASELASNIFKYAGTGEIQVRLLENGGKRGIEIVANDQGPGMDDVEQCMEDNYSSGGTLGLGLPGVRRLMDEFELESEPDRGTKVTIRKWQ